MAQVIRISGQLEQLSVKNIKHVGEEGARSGLAVLPDGREIEVYNHPDNGAVWHEQMSLEEWRASQRKEAQEKDHPPYDVTSHQQARAWKKWVYDATDDELLAALRGAGDSWNTVPASECADELKSRGYILIGQWPRQVTLERDPDRNVYEAGWGKIPPE